VPTTTPVRAIVADDHPVYRAGAASALERYGVEVVAECEDGRATLAAIRELKPDVALVDRFMEHLDGFAVLEAVSGAALPTRIVLISGFLDDADVYRAVELGAWGVLTKRVGFDELADTVLAVAGGATRLAGDVHARLAQAIRARSVRPAVLLTTREQIVLELMAQGLMTPAIAQHLHVSPSTVKSHTHHLFEKLCVNERAAAVAGGMRLGLIR
jgi:two-component system nitrate/nitrite response regulator NarL